MKIEDYNAGVARVLRENPEEPLLKTLQQGFRAINVAYLKVALKRLNAVDRSPIGEVDTRPSLKKPAKTPDETLKKLWSDRQHLFGEMNKLSNSFHTCKSDADRKQVSQSIRAVWDQILEIKAKIEHYEEFGKLPEPATEKDRFELPDDPVLLMKKLASIRAQISQEQQKLRSLAELPDDMPDKAERIKESEARRAHLILYKGHAEQKIKDLQ